MTLENLVSIGVLQKAHDETGATLRLVAAARRNLAEASLAGISSETRFDLAYKCILKLAMAGLAAKGYRTSQSRPGHHQTAIQSLVWTLGTSSHTLITLESLRKQRNVSDYSGDPVSDAVAQVCVEEAIALLRRATGALLSVDPERMTKPQ